MGSSIKRNIKCKSESFNELKETLITELSMLGTPDFKADNKFDFRDRSTYNTFLVSTKISGALEKSANGTYQIKFVYDCSLNAIAVLLLIFPPVFLVCLFLPFIQQGKIKNEINSIIDRVQSQCDRFTQPKKISSTSESQNPVEMLEKLSDLKSKGIITQDEFDEKKKKLMAEI